MFRSVRETRILTGSRLASYLYRQKKSVAKEYFARFFHKHTTAPGYLQKSYDAIIVGGGHNGLISAAYLQKYGLNVCVLERRHVIGGAAVTEEIVPGFKFSRASYLLSLLRPNIISDLKLKEFGLKYYIREPYCSYTPIRESLWSKFPAKSLLLSNDTKRSQEEIAKFSLRDAQNYLNYEQEMTQFVNAINYLIDSPPVELSWGRRLSFKGLIEIIPLVKAMLAIGKSIPSFQQLLTAPTSKILDKWFESEPLKATLATDALIGAMHGPSSPGNGYVLLHHVMGGVEGKAGAWAYVEGGMGSLSEAIASSAIAIGAHIFTDEEVTQILYEEKTGQIETTGVVTKSGKEVNSKVVFSGTTPHVTFNQLLRLSSDKQLQNHVGRDFVNGINSIDYTSPVTKINVALSRLPNFSANPSTTVADWHKCSIHINCEDMSTLEESYEYCHKNKMASERPMIEMVIPSSLDPTLAPSGSHVCLFFTQYTPYSPANGSWTDPKFKEAYAQKVFDCIEEYAPGFKESIVGTDILSPVDLEGIFNLTGGNIFHGAMGLDQIYFLRPILTNKCSFPETPLRGLYICGSGSHPGGGVMGLPGLIAVKAFLKNRRK